MIMPTRSISGGVPRRDPRRHRAGARFDHGSICLCAGGLPRALLFVSEALSCRQGHRRRMPDLDCVIVSGKTHMGTNCCRRTRGRKLLIETVATHEDEPASGSIRRARPACERAYGICTPISPATADTYARQVLGIREDDVCLSAAKLFSPTASQRDDLSMSVGATTHPQFRAPDAGCHVRADEQISSDHLLRRADLVCRDAQR